MTQFRYRLTVYGKGDDGYSYYGDVINTYEFRWLVSCSAWCKATGLYGRVDVVGSAYGAACYIDDKGNVTENIQRHN